jgi:TonB family protein
VSHLGPSLRRRRRAQRTWPRLAAAVAASLLANALLLGFARVGFVHPPAGPSRRVAVAPLSAGEWERNRAVQASPAQPQRAPPAVAPRELPPQERREAPGQVVDVAPSQDSTPPKDSRFVAERDNTVEKETISRHRRPGYENTAPVPTDPRGAKPKDEVAAARRAEAGGRPARQGAADGTAARNAPGAPGLPDRPASERLALAPDAAGERASRPDRPEVRGGQGAVAPGTPSAPADGRDGEGGSGDAVDPSKLMPSASTYDRLAGGPAPDHVEGVEEGEGTFLNTREWKYASYFNRIKQQVANTWDPNRALQLRDPDGSRFAYRDRYTLVAVRLDDRGGLKSVDVVKSSGVDFLDATAAEAFRRAQPFVNPPRGLADHHGEIVFNFGFYIETGGGLRMFRAAR